MPSVPPPPPEREVVCVGSPRELGRAQGAALGAKIRRARETLRELEAFRMEQPAFLPYPMFRWLAERTASRALSQALQRQNPAAGERLLGIAEASGVSPKSLDLLNAMEALLCSLEDRVVASVPGACSALAVRGARSSTGEPVIAKNFDYLPLVQPLYSMRESRPAGRFRSLEFFLAPQAGTVDGVNEHGLAITYNYAFATDPAVPAPLISMAISDALATTKTVAEAAELIASRARWGAGILMLADASGDVASLELSNTRAAIRRPDAGTDTLSFTNVYACPATRAIEVAQGAVFGDRVPVALRATPVLAPHARRATRIASLLSGDAALSPGDLARILADHGETGTPDACSPCVHAPYWATTATLQLFPRSRRIRVSYSSACTAQFRDLAL